MSVSNPVPNFHENFPVKIWIGIFSFTLICLTITISALIFSIYRFRCKTDRSHIRVKLFSILSLFFFIFAQIFHHLYVYYIKLPHGIIDQLTINFWTICNSCWSIGYLFTYLLFFERIVQTFDQSIHKLKPKTKGTFLSLVFCYIFSQQLTSVLWLLYGLGYIGWDGFHRVWPLVLWMRFTVDFVLNVYIIIIFCSKVFKTTVEYKQHTATSPNSPIESSPSSPPSSSSKRSTSWRTEHSFNVFNVMIKYFLLTLVTVISTQIFTISEILLSSAVDHAKSRNEFDIYYISYGFYFVFAAIDSMVSTSYIFLSFPFSKKCYDTVCICGHRKCVNLWMKCAGIQSYKYDSTIDNL